jgi:UPF0755 protein
MADRAERTAEEREAARLERERRRGRAPQAAEARLPRAAEARATPAVAARATPAADVEAHRAGDVDDRSASGPAPDGPAPDGPEHDGEVPAGTRRVGWRERQRVAPPRPGAQRRPRKLVGRLLAILVLIIAAAVIWFCVELFQPFHGSGHGSVTVTIPPRSGAHQVGDLLAREGVVSSGFFFYLRAKLGGDSGKLYAGTYHLKFGMSYGEVLKVLTTPPPKIPVTNVTTIPGDTRVQVDALLHSEGVAGSYAAATRASPLLRPTWYGAPKSTPSLEGFLFPDTYQLRTPISISTLVADQLDQFRHVFSQVNTSYARSHGLTPYDVLIVASIVEKEAATARDRPLVASVIYNRLKDGIPLGMDSTTRYEFNDYTKPLTQSQLAAPSPYNTRLNKGLPPTPIDSPGLASIQAAARPAQTNYLYFVVKVCGNNEMVFTSNYTQFLADSARYEQARAARGGNAPNKC